MAILGNKQLMRNINEKTILKEIFLEKKIDRASLSRKTGLSGGTVTKIVSELIQKGLIKEVGESDSTGGRKPILLCINPDFGNILGIKIGLGYLHLALTKLNGKIISQDRIEFGEIADPEEISKLVKNYVDKQNKNGLVGIAAAVSGTVDPVKGIVLNSYILNWENVKLGSILKKYLKVPIYVMNDVDSFTVSHIWKGNLKDFQNSIVITLGVGIGGSLVINGNLYTGNGGAGEFGHMTIKEKGNKCSCGNNGCLEAEAGFRALAEKIYQKSQNKKIIENYKNFKNTEISEIDFIKLALKEDLKISRKIFDEYAISIGIALKNLINVFAPQYILIGGEAIEFSDYFLEKAVNFAKENAFGNLGERVIFDVDTFGPEAWTLGGVYQVIQEELFDIKV